MTPKAFQIFATLILHEHPTTLLKIPLTVRGRVFSTLCRKQEPSENVLGLRKLHVVIIVSAHSFFFAAATLERLWFFVYTQKILKKKKV